MVLELLNFINDDLKWNTVKKGRRSIGGRPRKLGLGENCFISNKSGTDVVGRQAAAPLKKRRVLGQSQSPSPPPQTTCLHGDGVLTPGPQTPSFHYEDPSQRCRSSSLSQKSKSKSRLKKTQKEYDFSGIELLAAAACSSFIDDNTNHVKDVSVVKEQTTPGVNSCNVDIKEALISTESDCLLFQEQGVEKKIAPSKGLRLHWDLNTIMDNWEEPCNDLAAHENCSEGVKLELEDAVSAVPLIENCSEGVKLKLEDAVPAVPLIGNCSEDVKLKLEIEICSEGVKLNLEDAVPAVPLNETCSEGVKLKLEEAVPAVPMIEKCSEGVKLEIEDAVSAVPLIESTNGGSFGIRNESIKELSCSEEVMGTKTNTSKTSDCESCVSKSNMGESLIQQQPVSEETTQVVCESPKLCKSEDRASECGSNVSQMGEEKVEVGYESPFEDGELRESIGSEEKDESDNNKDDVSTIGNPLSEKLEVSVQHSQRDLEESDCGSGKEVFGRKIGHGESRSVGGNESTSFRRNRSSDIEGCYSRYEQQRPRNYSYRPQNRHRRVSPSERNSGYGIHGVRSDRYWRRTPEEERKVGCYSGVRRRPRSRSGSPPIAWHFRNQKNLDPPDAQFRDDKRQPIDHFRSRRFSSVPGKDHKYKENVDEKVKAVGRFDDACSFRRLNDSFQTPNRSQHKDAVIPETKS